MNQARQPDSVRPEQRSAPPNRVCPECYHAPPNSICPESACNVSSHTTHGGPAVYTHRSRLARVIRMMRYLTGRMYSALPNVCLPPMQRCAAKATESPHRAQKPFLPSPLPFAHTHPPQNLSIYPLSNFHPTTGEPHTHPLFPLTPPLDTPLYPFTPLMPPRPVTLDN